MVRLFGDSASSVPCHETDDKDFPRGWADSNVGVSTMPKKPPFPESDRDGDRSAPNINEIIGRILHEPTARSGK